MSEPCCTFTRPDGSPCAARPLPERPFCLFHDPDQAGPLTAARSKGGAAPRRRIRRYPRLLDHYHIAELLGELLVDALNHADPTNTKCLQAITNLSRALLKAVGTPNDQYMEHDDRSEPASREDPLLRIYPPLPPDVEALLATEPLADLAPDPDPQTPGPEPRNTPTPEHPTEEQGPEQVLDRTRTGLPPTAALPASPLTAFSSTDPATLPAAPAGQRTAEPPTEPLNPRTPNTEHQTPDPLNPRTPNTEHQTPDPLSPEQVADRCGTGPSATNRFHRSVRSVRSAGDPLPPGQAPATAEPLSSQPAGNRLPSAEPAPALHPAGDEFPGISSLRRETRHSASALGGYGLASGCVIRDTPWRPRQP